MKAPKILDNKFNFVYQELTENIRKGSKVSVVSALFSMYAYDKLKKDLHFANVEIFQCDLTNFSDVEKN